MTTIPADWIETGAIAGYENNSGCNDWDKLDDQTRGFWLSDTDATLTAVVPLIVADTLRKAIAELDDDAWGLEDDTADGMERALGELRDMLAKIDAS